MNATVQPSNQQIPGQAALLTGPMIFVKPFKPKLEFFENTNSRFVSIADHRSVLRLPETESESSESSKTKASELKELPKRRHFRITLPKNHRGVTVAKWEKNPSRWPTQKN